MKDKRQGNDLKVAWSIFMQDGEPFRLDGKDVSLYLKNMFGRKELNDFVTTGNIIQWTFYGKDQKNTGKYSLELVINEGEKGMITTDACDFVRLVSCSCKLQGGEDAPNVETESIELTSTLEYVAGGGDYDDTALWKELENKVDKVEGFGLSEENYTTEEKEKLAGLENYDDAKLKEELSETYQPKENIYYLDWDSASGSGELDEATYQAIMAADKVCLKNNTSITEPISKVSDGVECAYGFVADKYYVLFVFKSNYVIFPSPYYDDTELRDIIADLDNQVSARREEIMNLEYSKADKSELTELSAEVGKKQDTITDLENIRSGAAKGATAIQEVKTINGQSIVGEGDITIQGGGGGASNEWKCIADRRLLEGEKNIIFTTYADGTPLKAKEVMVQMLGDTSSQKSINGYVAIHSTNNKTRSLYGAIYFEKNSFSAQSPYLQQMHLKASPFMYMVAEMYTDVRCAVATLSNQQVQGGSIPFQIYEDIVSIELAPNEALTSAAPYLKIYAR